MAAAQNRSEPVVATPPVQSQLKLGEPRARTYRTTSKLARARFDPRLWASRLTTVGAFVSIGVLLYLLLFTNPARTENVLAFLATVGFVVLFAVWSLGYWARISIRRMPADFSTWPVTRQAVLAGVGVVALVTIVLNRLASAGVLVLIALALVTAELVLRRMRVRQ